MTGEADCKSGLEAEGAAGLGSATANTEVGIDPTSESGSEVGTRIGSEDGVEAKSEDGVGRDSIKLEEEVEAEFDSFELG
jgi:hypothetical protein